MTSILSRTEVLAIRCIGDVVLVGMGSTLYSYRRGKFAYKLNCLYPSNIHGIVEETKTKNYINNKLAVFGAKSVCICKVVDNANNIRIRKQSTHEFNDWIIAVKWISFNQQTRLAILFAHNYVSLYDLLNKTSYVIRCEETCILYGGSISGTCPEDLVIFSGTVFQEILIWKIDKRHDVNKRMPVLHRLTGHKGVIFSVIYDPHSRYICSTSDDRSVKFWKVTEHENSESNNVNWQTVEVVPIKTMFMHTARVWKAVIKNDVILTIGEDSRVCTWSLSGNLLNIAYYKAPIWSIDVSENNTMIYVGGGDGSVYMQPFKNYKTPETIVLPGNDTHNFPKYISYLHDGAVLVFTELGTLLHYNKEKMHTNTICLTEDHYYIMQVSPNRSFVALASRGGHIIIYKVYLGALQLCAESKEMNPQIFSLHWLSDKMLIACGTNGLLKLFRLIVEDNNAKVLAEYILPSSRERWLTAAIIHKRESILVCGDRAGNIHVYELIYRLHSDLELQKPIQTLHRIHGKMGVQSFHIFEENLITSGRDGMLRFYHTASEDGKLSLLYKKKMPMDWISGMVKVDMEREIGDIDDIDDIDDTDDTGDIDNINDWDLNDLNNSGDINDEMLFIFGFKEVEFIIYNLLNESIVVRIPCGGGHRSWDCIISHTKTSFAYIKDKQMHVCDLSYSLFSSRPILQTGFHTKETCCLRYVSYFSYSDYESKDFFVSGGEDCTLRISKVFKSGFKSNSFKNLAIFNGHLSSIKCISVIELHDSMPNSLQYIIFSGGGRAQLKVWGIPYPRGKVCCLDMKSYMLYEENQYCKKPWQETKQSCIAEPETRYMDIYAYYNCIYVNYVLVFIACADGYLRLLVYDIVQRNIYLKVSTKYVDRCILKIYILSYESKVIVLTMSTDGNLRFFDFTDIVSKIYEDANSENQNIVNFSDIPFAEFRLHQSGINCFDLKKKYKDRYLFVTGGDDNLLSVIYFQICISENNKLSAEILTRWSTTTAHSAKIVGVRFTDDKIYSVGVDQQMIIHNYLYSNGVLCVNILNQVFTSVTDVQGMELCSVHFKYLTGKRDDVLCIYGRGFEMINPSELD